MAKKKDWTNVLSEFYQTKEFNNKVWDDYTKDFENESLAISIIKVFLKMKFRDKTAITTNNCNYRSNLHNHFSSACRLLGLNDKELIDKFQELESTLKGNPDYFNILTTKINELKFKDSFMETLEQIKDTCNNMVKDPSFTIVESNIKLKGIEYKRLYCISQYYGNPNINIGVWVGEDINGYYFYGPLGTKVVNSLGNRYPSDLHKYFDDTNKLKENILMLLKLYLSIAKRVKDDELEYKTYSSIDPFIRDLSDTKWNTIDYVVCNGDGGFGYTAHSIKEVQEQLDDVYHYDQPGRDSILVYKVM